ncbi:MAG TPA: Fic family protein [Candidatus Hydrogenedentes bacterium]|nr:Fic family protein [Candidatus Hydrogenedentota bacterium]
MRKPQLPPSFEVLQERMDSAQEFWANLSKVKESSAFKQYLHWEEVRHRTPPEGLTHEQWWTGLKVLRRLEYKQTPLRDKQGKAFVFSTPDKVIEHLHMLDRRAGGMQDNSTHFIDHKMHDQYMIASLMEEAATSSQLEGAATTRQEAQALLRSGRAPVNRHERMILNNFRTMRRLLDLVNETMSAELLLDIHRWITEDTMEDAAAAGRFRTESDKVYVSDQTEDVLFVPPPAGELKARMEALYMFSNGNTPDYFLHPVLRSMMLHFWLAYDHPFVDGNGRVARALFYWSMLRHHYWLMEFVSISPILLLAPSGYARAFLYTETDDNDLTYFLLHQVRVLDKAVKELDAHLLRKIREGQEAERRLQGLEELNHRQRGLITHALHHPNAQYTIASHRNSHGVTYQTARTDLLELEALGLLNKTTKGKAFFFTPVVKLEKRLGNTA